MGLVLKIKSWNFELTPVKLCFLTALFIVVTGNLTFWSQVSNVYEVGQYLFFHASLAFFLILLIALVTALLSLVMPVRLAASLMLIFATLSGHFNDTFGVIIDDDMLRNAFESNSAEAFDLLSLNLGIRFLLLGVAPIAAIWLLPLRQDTWKRTIRDLSLIMVGSLTLILANVFVMSDSYASFFREHKPLRFYTNPTYPIYSLGKLAGNAITPALDTTYRPMTTYARLPEIADKPKLFVMVVGETARADRFSLNGYEKQTNPLLEAEGSLVSFSNMWACGTSTALSVPCMFAYRNRDNFNINTAKNIENTLDTLHKAGVSILWRDNNSSSKGVADRLAFESFRTSRLNPVCSETECRDIGMLSGLQDYINAQSGDIMIVLHHMGSHGPAYYKRYPKEFEKFTPTCKTQELSDCTLEEINNAYDNTIVYTDYFLSEIISLLKANNPAFDTTMLYISDHGESLGENGLYLHGLPYFIAPDEQTHVPFVLWTNKDSDIDLEKSRDLKDKRFEHDALSYGILKLFDVDSDAPINATAGDFLFKKTPIRLVKDETAKTNN